MKNRKSLSVHRNNTARNLVHDDLLAPNAELNIRVGETNGHKIHRPVTGAKLLVLLLCIHLPAGLSEVVAQVTSYGQLGYKRADTIVIASEPDYPPYCIIDKNGNPGGFSVELFRKAANAAGIEVIIKIGIWNRIRNDLTEGSIDALPFVGRTPEREELYDFTLPYLSLHGAVFVQRGKSDISSIADLKDKRVGVMRGDNAEEYVLRHNISDQLIATHTFEEAFRMLEGGTLDAVVTQRLMGLTLLKELNIRSIVPLDVQIPEFRQDFCFAVRKGNAELLSRLNEGLSIVIANKEFDALHLKWFGRTVKGFPSTWKIVRLLAIILVPLLTIVGFASSIFLRREVRRRTLMLRKEIAERIKTENELVDLKNQLEDKIEERTLLLNEQIDKLNKSQEAMLVMVEDLNKLTVELKEERLKLQLTNKELETFSYSVSHDLRAPLRAIDGYSNILFEDYSGVLDQEGLRLLSLLRENSQKMDRLITDLLALSRVSRSELNFLRIDMEEMARSIFNELSDDTEKESATFSVGELPVAFADPILMKQVWSNLISNSIKYTKPKEKRNIYVSGRAENGFNFYSVIDNGVGFNPAYTHKIFETFQRLHRSDQFEGTGVGLSIVQRIILRHGGTVGADGIEGEGATVWFSLPAQIHSVDTRHNN
jgi:signal transduction histidine kinase